MVRTRAARRRSAVRLQDALGNQRALATFLACFEDIRDLEALACTSWVGFKGNDGMPEGGENSHMDQIFADEYRWESEILQLEDELRGVTSCTADEWRETYRDKFLRLATLGLWLREDQAWVVQEASAPVDRTILTLPTGATDDMIDLEAEAARLHAADPWRQAEERVSGLVVKPEWLKPLEIAKLACHAHRWRDPWGEGHDDAIWTGEYGDLRSGFPVWDLGPGWTLPPRSALQFPLRASPFAPPPRMWSSRRPTDDIIYYFQGHSIVPQRLVHQEIELRVLATFQLGPDRVPSVGASLLNLGGALDADRALIVQAERQRHADVVAARWTDCVRAAATARHARELLTTRNASIMYRAERDQRRSFEIEHMNLHELHRDVLAEADYALGAGHLPEALVEAIRQRYIPLAHHQYRDRRPSHGITAQGHTTLYDTVVFTFAAKRVDSCDVFDDVTTCEFLCRACGNNQRWRNEGELFMQEVNIGITGSHAVHTAHHLWKWYDEFYQGAPVGYDYGETSPFQSLHRAMMGYEWGDGPVMEPNQIIRALLLCSGYKFSRQPQHSHQHRPRTIIPRGASSNRNCVAAWHLLQDIWEKTDGGRRLELQAPEVSYVAEPVFAVH